MSCSRSYGDASRNGVHRLAARVPVAALDHARKLIRGVDCSATAQPAWKTACAIGTFRIIRRTSPINIAVEPVCVYTVPVVARRDIYTASRFMAPTCWTAPFSFFFSWRKLKYISRKPARFYCSISRRVLHSAIRSIRIFVVIRSWMPASLLFAVIVISAFKSFRFCNFQSSDLLRSQIFTLLLFYFMCGLSERVCMLPRLFYALGL